MKKVLTVVLMSITLIGMTAKAEETEIDKVREFLLNCSSDADTFYVEEYPNLSDRKDLFVRISAVPEDIIIDSKYDIVSKEDDFLAEMAKQEWFDYDVIYCIFFSENSGFMNFNKYFVNRGIKSWWDGTFHPWIINTENDLPEDTKLFLGRVAQELLQYNIDTGVNLNIGMGGEEDLSIEECAGNAIVRGECEYNGKTYNYVTEFTYDSKDEWNGTYDTIYIGVNDLDLYGKYTPMEGLEVK